MRTACRETAPQIALRNFSKEAREDSIYIYIYIYTHTHTHIYTHTYMYIYI